MSNGDSIRRAVLYARVSGDDRGREGRGLAGQLDMCREYARSHSYRIMAELAEDDRGASGAALDLPELSQALSMARSGEFDVLVVRELDRFARRLAKQLIVESEFKRAGVQIEYVLGDYADTPEGNLMKNVRAVVAEYEALKINERMRRGRRLKVKAGSVLVAGHPPYGYRTADRDGKFHLEIYGPEAHTVRLIFRWYTVGDGERGPIPIRGITRKLNQMGVPPPESGIIKAREWGHSTVRRLLNNPTYSGQWVYGKTRRGKLNSPDNFLYVEVPAIVSHDVWQTAQVQLVKNATQTSRNVKYEYLMLRRLNCRRCGSALHGDGQTHGDKVYKYYVCAARERKESDCKPSNVVAVDAAIWRWIKSLILDPEALKHGLQRYLAEREQASAPARERLVVIEDLLAEKRTQFERLLDLYMSGEFVKEMLVDRKKRLETEIRALEQEYTSLSVQLEAQSLTSDQMQDIQAFAEEVAKGLGAADEDFATRRWVIELLDVRATLAVEGGEQVLYTQCIIGQDALRVSTTATCDRRPYRYRPPDQ